MIEVTCSGCRNILRVEDRYAGQTGRCNRCGSPLQVPWPGEQDQDNHYVAPESFGHYSKAKEEHWEDPVDQVEGEVNLGEIPPEILKKHEALKRERKKKLTKLSLMGAGAALAVLALALYLIFGRSSGPDTASQSEPPPTVADPAPAPPVAAPVVPPVSPQSTTVYAVESDWRYHRENCQLYVNGVGAKHSGTVPQALAAGYQPCQLCKPPVASPAPPAPFPVPAAPSSPAPAAPPSGN